MKVNNYQEAWNEATRIVGNVERNLEKSASAGYPIYTTEDEESWVCDLNGRLEVNTPTETINIWIANEKTAIEDMILKHNKVAKAITNSDLKVNIDVAMYLMQVVSAIVAEAVSIVDFARKNGIDCKCDMQSGVIYY